MNKEWRKIKGFGTYSVSSFGEVRNDTSGRILRLRVSTSGYMCVCLVENKHKFLRYVHRLVGAAFIDNPDSLPQIDHIDGDKKNNRVDNLRWVTARENYYLYGFERRTENRKSPVLAEHKSGEKIVFDSRVALARHFHCHPSKVKYDHWYVKSEKKGWKFEKMKI